MPENTPVKFYLHFSHEIRRKHIEALLSGRLENSQIVDAGRKADIILFDHPSKFDKAWNKDTQTIVYVPEKTIKHKLPEYVITIPQFTIAAIREVVEKRSNGTQTATTKTSPVFPADLRVLVVDDHESNLARAKVQIKGCSLTTGGYFLEANAILRTAVFDVMLLSLNARPNHHLNGLVQSFLLLMQAVECKIKMVAIISDPPIGDTSPIWEERTRSSITLGETTCWFFTTSRDAEGKDWLDPLTRIVPMSFST